VIAGQEMEPCERSRDSTACAYSSYYNTDGFSPSKRGQRQDLIIAMKVGTYIYILSLNQHRQLAV
jgi:hypothetical protein